MLAPVLSSPESTVQGHSVRLFAGWSTEPTDRALLEACQRLRGTCYLADGAIVAADLTSDGRFSRPQDQEALHFALLDPQASPIGTASYRLGTDLPNLDDLLLGQSPLFHHQATRERFARWSDSSRSADPRPRRTWFEAYGLAVAPRARHSRAVLVTLMAGWAVGRLAHEATALCLTTDRHDAAAIFLKLGHQPLLEGGTSIGPVFDHRYGCQMHLTWCSSSTVKPGVKTLVENLVSALASQQPLIEAALMPPSFPPPPDAPPDRCHLSPHFSA